MPYALLARHVSFYLRLTLLCLVPGRACPRLAGDHGGWVFVGTSWQVLKKPRHGGPCWLKVNDTSRASQGHKGLETSQSIKDRRTYIDKTPIGPGVCLLRGTPIKVYE